MGEIKLFEKEAFGKVRVVIHNGEPWFIAKDLCECLGLENISEALRGLDEDEKITLSNPDGNPRAGIPHQMNVVSESGLYSLVIRSRKPEAKAFKRWVTHEVLPSIRKTGQYGGIPDFTDPVAAARAWADAMEAKRSLEQRNEQLVNTVTDLRDIEAVLSQVPENFVKPNFGLYEYPIETGIGTRTAKAYLLSKDAFTLLTRSLTSATLHPLSTRMPSAKESPRSLTGPGAHAIRKLRAQLTACQPGRRIYENLN